MAPSDSVQSILTYVLNKYAFNTIQKCWLCNDVSTFIGHIPMHKYM